jgi:hypothetical protein
VPDPSSCAPADVRLWTALYTHTVDHQAAVRDAEAQHAVPTAAHADLEVALAAVADRVGHVAALAQRTLARGRRSTMAFQTVRAWS